MLSASHAEKKHKKGSMIVKQIFLESIRKNCIAVIKENSLQEKTACADLQFLSLNLQFYFLC